jgi:AAA+ superfamily predicted ATPase
VDLLLNSPDAEQPGMIEPIENTPQRPRAQGDTQHAGARFQPEPVDCNDLADGSRMSEPQRDQDRFEALLDAHHAAISIVTNEEAPARALVEHWCRATGNYLWEWSLIGGIRSPLTSEPPITETTNPSAALVWMARRELPGVFMLLDIAAHLDDPYAVRALRELIAAASATNSHVVLIDHSQKLPSVIEAFTTPFDLSLPSAEEIEAAIRATLKRLHRERPIEIELSNHQYQMVVKNLAGLPLRQAEQIILDVVALDRRLDGDDLNHILACKRQLMSRDRMLDFVESPATLDDVGGLESLKKWLKLRERSFDAEAERFGLSPPRGVLLLGVQGAGKSLCAKAIATAWQRPLLRMDTGSLYDRYVGESERRLRMALRQAEAVAPVVLWIDEIEKAFASAAAQSTDGGLSQRMFGTLLTWMQDHTEPVFLVATANNIDALPPELLRKGRFDEIFFVDLPGPAARAKIFDIHLRRRSRDPAAFDLPALVAASDGYSGAEIEQAIIAGLHGAFSERAQLTTPRLLAALEHSPPLSVTMAEKVARLRAWAAKRCVPAD